MRTGWPSGLRRCSAERKVRGSIPGDGGDIFPKDGDCEKGGREERKMWKKEERAKWKEDRGKRKEQ